MGMKEAGAWLKKSPLSSPDDKKGDWWRSPTPPPATMARGSIAGREGGRGRPWLPWWAGLVQKLGQVEGLDWVAPPGLRSPTPVRTGPWPASIRATAVDLARAAEESFPIGEEPMLETGDYARAWGATMDRLAHNVQGLPARVGPELDRLAARMGLESSVPPPEAYPSPPPLPESVEEAPSLRDVWEDLKRREGVLGRLVGGAEMAGKGVMAAFNLGSRIPEEAMGAIDIAPMLREDLEREYGTGPEVEAAIGDVLLMSHSSMPGWREILPWGDRWERAPWYMRSRTEEGYNRMLRAARRRLEGEDAVAVREGVPGVADSLQAAAIHVGVMPDENGAWHLDDESMPLVVDAIRQDPAASSYFDFATRELAQQGTEEPEAMRLVAEGLLQRGVPGEEDIGKELVYRTVFDLTNLLGSGAKGREGRFLGAAADDMLRLTDDTAEAVFRATQVERKGIYWFLDKLPQARQSKIMRDTADLLHLSLSRVPREEVPAILTAIADLASDNSDDMARALRTLDGVGLGRRIAGAEDAAAYGLEAGEVISIWESKNGKRASYFIRQALTDTDGAFNPRALLKEVREAETTEDALLSVLARMERTARELYPTKKLPAALRANNSIRGFYAKYVHMGYILGYAFRNAIQNFVQGAIDGVLGVGFRAGRVFDDFGYVPTAAARGLGGGPAGEFAREAAEALTRREKIGRFFQEGPAIVISGHIEEAFGRPAVAAGMRRVATRHWRVGGLIDEEDVVRLIDEVGEPLGSAIVSDLLRARRPDRLDDIIDWVREATGYRELWRRVDPDLMARLDEIGYGDEVADLVRSAPDEAAFQRGIQSLIDEAWERGSKIGDAAIPRGSSAGRFAEAEDTVIARHGGWEKLPGPVTPDAVEEGRAILAKIGRQINAAESKAAYYATRSGMAEEFGEVYRTVASHRLRVQENVANLLDRTLEALESSPKEDWSGIWRLYRDARHAEYSSHYDFAIEAFGRFSDAASQVEGQQVTDDIVRAVASIVDDGHMPTPAEIADGVAPEIEEALRATERDVLGRWGKEIGGELSPRQLEVVESFIGKQRQRLNEMRAVAGRVGEMVRDFAYHNYSDRRNVDTVMGVLFQYPFWYSRTYAKWVVRAVDQPYVIAAYIKLRKALQQENAGLPEWWRDQVHIADILGDGVYLPLDATFNPLAGMMDAFRSPERARTTVFGLPVGRWAQEFQAQSGSTPNILLGYIMGAAAAAEGDKEAALAWVGYQSQYGRALPPLTALARETIPGAERVIPPGGVASPLEAHMFEVTDEGIRFRGSLYDRRRIGYILADMVRQGELSPAQADLVAYYGEGEKWDEAAQQQMLSQVIPALASWMLGPGLKPRRDYQVELARMWDVVTTLRNEREKMSPDEYSAAWTELKKRWPYFNAVMMARMDDDARDEALAWSVIGRLPPGWRGRRMMADLHIDLLQQKFYDSRGDMSEWSDDDRREFMAGIIRLAGETEYPDEATQDEWDAVRSLNRELRSNLQRRFGENIFDVEEEYFRIRDEEGNDAARSYLEQYPRLPDMWVAREEERQNEPLLRKYYIEPPPTPEETEESRRSFLRGEVAARWPEVDIYAIQGGYFDIPEDNKAARRAYLKTHPELKEFWGLQAAIGLREETEPRLQFIFDAYDMAEEKWPGIRNTQDEYFRIKEAEGKEAARQYLREHPELKEYWDFISSVKEVAEEGGEERGGVPLSLGKETSVVRSPSSAVHGGVTYRTYGGAYGGGNRRSGGRQRRGGGGGGWSSVRSWDDFAALASPDAMEALFAYWEGGDTSKGAKKALRRLYKKIGWGGFNQWLTYLLGLYQRQFPSFGETARRVPRVKYPKWIRV